MSVVPLIISLLSISIPSFPLSPSPCSHSNWWTNLLFINNLFPWKSNYSEMCMGWSFYLALDLQMYLLVPLLISLYLFSAMAGILLVSSAAVASIVAAGAVVYANNITSLFNLTSSAVANAQGPGYSSYSSSYADIFMTKPWMRLPAFLIGVLLAFAWDRVQQARLQHEAEEAGLATVPSNAIGIET